MAIHATGAAELRQIAAMCKAVASDGEIARGVTKVTMRGEGAISTAFRVHAVAVLPHRGGLGAWVAESKVNFRAIRGSQDGGARIKVGRGTRHGWRADLDGLDGGVAIHPDNSRAHRGWFSQPVPPESISEPIRNEGGNVLEAACLFALEDAAERIARA